MYSDIHKHRTLNTQKPGFHWAVRYSMAQHFERFNHKLTHFWSIEKWNGTVRAELLSYIMKAVDWRKGVPSQRFQTINILSFSWRVSGNDVCNKQQGQCLRTLLTILADIVIQSELDGSYRNRTNMTQSVYTQLPPWCLNFVWKRSLELAGPF